MSELVLRPRQEHGKRLRLEPDKVAAFSQLTIGGIECEGAETN